MKVLVLCDDLWHPAEVVELGLKQLDGMGFDFTVVKAAKDILTPALLAEYPVILCAKSNSVNAANSEPWFEEGVTEVGPPELEAYVRGGGGFLSLHSTNTASEFSPLAGLIGNHFLGHPPRCAVRVEPDASHPLAEGVEPFTVRDEHYRITVTADDADVFCTTVSEDGGEQAGGYTRKLGDGRLCVLTPGHTYEVWRNPMFQRLIANAIRWCAKAQTLS